MEEEKQTRIQLLQVKSSYGHTSIDVEAILNAEEGEVLSGFKVERVDELDCSHPERRWSFNGNKRQDSEEPPQITGKCNVCGDVKEIDPEE